MFEKVVNNHKIFSGLDGTYLVVAPDGTEYAVKDAGDAIRTAENGGVVDGIYYNAIRKRDSVMTDNS